MDGSFGAIFPSLVSPKLLSLVSSHECLACVSLLWDFGSNANHPANSSLQFFQLKEKYSRDLVLIRVRTTNDSFQLSGRISETCFRQVSGCLPGPPPQCKRQSPATSRCQRRTAVLSRSRNWWKELERWGRIAFQRHNTGTSCWQAW